MKDYMAIADAFVSDFVDRHVRTRILDGRPDRVLTKTLTIEIGQLLRNEFEALEAEKPSKKTKGAVS
jgi:hypothetical protein